MGEEEFKESREVCEFLGGKQKVENGKKGERQNERRGVGRTEKRKEKGQGKG